MKCFVKIKLCCTWMRKEANMILPLSVSPVDPHLDAEDHLTPSTPVQANQVHRSARRIIVYSSALLTRQDKTKMMVPKSQPAWLLSR